ncbi:MAG: FkbM family methyltransferase [Planctomycetota bacterium]
MANRQAAVVGEDWARGLNRWHEAVLWRRRVAAQGRFFRRVFRNGCELETAWREHRAATQAVLRDGRVLVHGDRPGLAETLVEVWHHRGYTQGLYRAGGAGGLKRGKMAGKQAAVVVDAGANVGVFAADVLRRQPGVRVLAIEPDAENLPALRANLSAFGGSETDIIAGALGPTSGEAVLVRSERSLDHRVAFDDVDVAEHRDQGPGRAVGADGGSDRVEVVTLEGVMERAGVDRVALLKLDIEGAEYALLDAVSDAVLRRCERIAIEPHPRLTGRSVGELVERLEGLFEVRAYGPLLQARRR